MDFTIIRYSVQYWNDVPPEADDMALLHIPLVEQLLIPYTGYHYFVPNYDVCRQIGVFLNVASQGHNNLPLILDVEYLAAALSPRTVADRIKQALDIIEDYTNRRPIIYTRAEWWNSFVERRTYWKDYLLWIARYNEYLNHPWGDGKYKPLDWNECLLWQYTESGDGFRYGLSSPWIDLDYYMETKEHFIGMLQNYPVINPVTNILYKTLYSGIRIRSTPDASTTSNVIGVRSFGEVVQPLEFGGKDIWVRDEKGWSVIYTGGKKYMDTVS